MSVVSLIFTSFLLSLIPMSLLWLVSLKLKNAGIVDIFWGPLFLIAALTGAWLGEGDLERTKLILVLVSAWSLRLAFHLGLRNLGHPEDRRYVAMRKKHGAKFWWVSALTVFLFQALLASIIALPIHVSMLSSQPPLGLLAGVGTIIFIVGLAFEVIADYQLKRFLAQPNQVGKVLNTGLWRYSRHPNYFGEALLWWGLGIISLETGAYYALLGPLFMNFLLLKVSGVVMLEKTIGSRRPGYEDYIRNTNAFFPGRPRKVSSH